MIPSSLISIEMQSAGSRGIGGKGHMNVNDGIYNPITQTVVPARNARRGASVSKAIFTLIHLDFVWPRAEGSSIDECKRRKRQYCPTKFYSW